MRNAKVDEKADGKAAQLQGRKKLRFMNTKQILDRLQLHYYCPLDQKIDSIANIDAKPAIGDGKTPFRLNMESPKMQFVREARAICALQQAGPEF